MTYRWNIPDEIEKDIKISSLEDTDLEFYHDQMHVFWNKIKDGRWFDWTFKEVYLTHKSIVVEMLKRKIDHIHPINNLDEIEFIKDIDELVKVVNYVVQKD